MPEISFTDEEYRNLFRTARGVAARHLADTSRAEDIAQDVLLCFWVRLGTSDSAPVVDPIKWVAAGARYAAVRKAGKSRMELPLSTVDAERPYRGDAERIEVRIALEELPEPYQEILQLRYVESMTIREIATTVGKSEGTVKRRLRQLRYALAEALRVVGIFL